MTQPATIRVPVFKDIKGPSGFEDRPYDELRGEYTRRLAQLPSFVATLKEADNYGWGRLFNDLAYDIQRDEALSTVVRVQNDGGRLSIGEPNWASPMPLAWAFAFGWAIGTACYDAGPCNFVP